MEGLLDLGVTSLAEPFPGLLPFHVGVGDVLPGIRPIHRNALLGAELAKFLPARGLLLGLVDRHSDLGKVGFNLAGFVLGKNLVGVLVPCGSFFPGFAFGGLALFRDTQSLFPGKVIAPGFQILQVCLAPLQLRPGFRIDGIDQNVGVKMLLVGMDGNQNLVAFESRGFLHQLPGVG